MGEALYVHTSWIFKWHENESFGSKINSRRQVESECGIALGESGGMGNTIHHDLVVCVGGGFYSSRAVRLIFNMGNIDGAKHRGIQSYGWSWGSERQEM